MSLRQFYGTQIILSYQLPKRGQMNRNRAGANNLTDSRGFCLARNLRPRAGRI